MPARNGKEPQPELSKAQRQATLLVAAGQGNKQIGEAVGASEFTVSRWRQEPHFRAEVNGLLADARQAAVDRLHAMVASALEAMAAILADAKTPPRDRLACASKVLELCSLSGGVIGPTDPELVERQRAHDVMMAELLCR
jgi:hypothetical protein